MAQRISAHQRLLDAAAELFYRYGIAATGIDAIVKEAGVAKKSLYNNFDSKAALVAAYLDLRHQAWLCLYEARLAEASTPIERIKAVFLAYEDHASEAYQHGFRGCGLLNAAAELPAGDEGRNTVRRHKNEVEALLRQHVQAYLHNDDTKAASLAHHLAFLLEGSMVRAGLEGHGKCLNDALQMAERLLEEYDHA